MTARKLEAAPLADLASDVLKLVPQLSDEEWAARDAAVAAERSALDDKSGDRMGQLLAYGFPKRAVKSIQRGITPVPAITRLRDAVGDDLGVCVLSGPKGSGKTVGATWWAAQRRGRVGFIRASTFATTSRYQDREARAELLAHPLVLDDLGAEYVDAKGSFLTDLDELLDTFYGDMRPLVITTNCTGDEFRKRYGERIADRLRECGRWISLTGDSFRRRNGEVAK